ncbi:hypothetical protein GCM10027048_39370 [Hymenobacter coalescens]
MNEAYFLALGFERWVSPLPLQTAMYVHSYAACDGARLYMAVPRSAAGSPTEECQRLAATVEAFFGKHGGRQAEPVVERLSLLT